MDGCALIGHLGDNFDVLFFKILNLKSAINKNVFVIPTNSVELSDHSQ